VVEGSASWQRRSGVDYPFLERGSTEQPFHTIASETNMDLIGIERTGVKMSVYRVIDVIGTSASSWEDAAREAISTAAGSLHDLRVAEVTKQDVVVGDGGTLLFRTKIQLSFKYAPE
jgi:flavin-binding protein dodecin